MIVKTMLQPSSWVEGSIKLQKVRGLNLFKFTDELQAGLETLISRKKANLLTPEETYATWRHLLHLGKPQDRSGFSTWGNPKTAVASELAGITELDRIFTLINARIIAES
jgi:hypothetical protein